MCRVSSNSENLSDLLFIYPFSQNRPEFFFDVFGVFHSSLEPNGQVPCKMGASDWQYRSELNGIPHKNRDVCGSSTDIYYDGSQFPFIPGEDCLGACQLLQVHFLYSHLSSINGINQVLVQCTFTCYDMNVHVEPRTGQADRIQNASVIIQKKFLRQNVNDLPVLGN